VPVADEQVENLPYVTFPEGSEEHTYLHAQRQKLHGYLPSRQPNFTRSWSCRPWKISLRCWKSRTKKSLPLSRSFVP
jgi:pyruvate dehydrogenase complex dehydrogenase (E1) component